MGWAARVGLAAVEIGAVGCGGAGDCSVRAARQPAPVTLAGSCTVDGVLVEVEEGVLGRFTGESPCSYSGRFVALWLATYEERWGTVPLEAWTVRIRAPEGGRLRPRRPDLVRPASDRAEPAALRAAPARAASRPPGRGLERPPRLVSGLRALGARAAHPGRGRPARLRPLKPA
jgi:hypothetical protein